MQIKKFTVKGAGRFAHITQIRQAHNFVTETWTDGSEDRSAARTVGQAREWLEERVSELHQAGCEIDAA